MNMTRVVIYKDKKDTSLSYFLVINDKDKTYIIMKGTYYKYMEYIEGICKLFNMLIDKQYASDYDDFYLDELIMRLKGYTCLLPLFTDELDSCAITELHKQLNMLTIDINKKKERMQKDGQERNDYQ